MKLPIVCLLALVAVATSNPKEAATQTLGEDLKEFRAMIPFMKIRSTVLRYFALDTEFQELVELIISDNFLPAIEEIEAMPEVRDVINYLHNHGSDIYKFINQLHIVLGLDPIQPFLPYSFRNTGGLVMFVEEIRALIPVPELRALYDHKLETSQPFQDFVEYLKSTRIQNAVDKILANKKVQNLINFLKSKKVNLQDVADVVTSILGIQFRPPTVTFRGSKDKQDKKGDMTTHALEVLHLIPTAKTIDLGNDYLASDPIFRASHLYLTSKMFETSYNNLRKTMEVKQLMKYMEGVGFSVDKYEKEVVTQFAFSQYNRKNATLAGKPKSGGFTAFLNDVKETMPKRLMNALIIVKNETVPNFQKFTSALTSPQFGTMYLNIMTSEEAKDMLIDASGFNVNIDAFFSFLYSTFGLPFIRKSNVL